MTDPLVAFYAAVTAVSEGHIAEAEVELTRERFEEGADRLTITIRKEVRPLNVQIENDD